MQQLEAHAGQCQTFRPMVEDVRGARTFIRETLACWGFNSTYAEMVVGELSANAVLHGRSSFTVEVSEGDGQIRVGVEDDNPRRPVKALTPLDARSGRGLRIVESLSTRWGVTSVAARGKVVWAELAVQLA